MMPETPDDTLNDAATREIKKLYFVLLRVLEMDDFLPAQELRLHAVRLARIFRNGAGIYRRRNLAPMDLKADFDHLFDKLIEASLEDELYEKTANLSRMRAYFEEVIADELVPAFEEIELVA